MAGPLCSLSELLLLPQPTLHGLRWSRLLQIGLSAIACGQCISMLHQFALTFSR